MLAGAGISNFAGAELRAFLAQFRLHRMQNTVDALNIANRRAREAIRK